MRAIVVHGGAGARPSADDAALAACEQAVALGWEILLHGGSALDAVVRAVVHLEDDPNLNAGYGACLTEGGGVELDASVMDGRARRAGAVALVRRLRNPVLAARAVMEEGRHVFMAGDAAEIFAQVRGLTLVDPATLVTAARRASWSARDDRADAPASRDDEPPGTVGAVALDSAGHVAAATSTGGIAGKRPGRIGDSPIIGAGTLADDRTGAASATGDGEAIMRATVASVALDALRDGLGPERATAIALDELTRAGGTGGLILLDRFGRMGASHTTPHMTWASRRDGDR